MQLNFQSRRKRAGQARVPGYYSSPRTKRHELQIRTRPKDGKTVLYVGLAFVCEDWFPQYIASQDHLGLEDADRNSCLYIEVMVADIKEYCQRTHRRAMFVDGWVGNDKKLIRIVSNVCSPTPAAAKMLGDCI